MRSTRNILAVALLLCAFTASLQAMSPLYNITKRHSININFPETLTPSTSRYNLVARLESGDLVFNISTLNVGSSHHHAHIKAVPFYGNSEEHWYSYVHLAHFCNDGQESRIHRFNLTNFTRNLNNYGPGPCEMMNPLRTEMVCRFNFSVANKWIPLFVQIKSPKFEWHSSVKILGTQVDNITESAEISWSEHWRVQNIIKKAQLHVLNNEPKAIMELKWDNSFNGSKAFKKLQVSKISFQSEKYNTTTEWKGLTTLQPTTYMFFSSYIFSEKDCQVWCNITLILTDPESPNTFYPVQVLKYRNPQSIKNFLIVGGFIIFACLVVFICWITRKRRTAKRGLLNMNHFREAPSAHYVVFHAAQQPQQHFLAQAQKPLLVHQQFWQH